MLYKRSRTRKWQARFKVGNYWKCFTTKCIELDKAKDNALEQYMVHLLKHKHGIPSVSKRFADIAKLSVVDMRRKLEARQISNVKRMIDNAGKGIFP